MLKDSALAQAIARDRVISSARPHSRTMNKIVVFRPACGAVGQGSAGLPTVQRGERRLQMRLASEIHPVFGVPTLCEDDTVFQRPAGNSTSSQRGAVSDLSWLLL